MRTYRDVTGQFPALGQSVHGRRLAYLDNAATTQRPTCVLEAMDRFGRHDNANVHRGVHTLSQRATDQFESARTSVAQFVGAHHDEIVFTKGCTEALNIVANSFGRTVLKHGDEVVVSEMEHHANLVPWQQACLDSGATLKPVRVTADGDLDLDDLAENLKTGKTRAVAVKHVCNAIGTVNPVAEICRLAHEYGAVVVVDGAQALAHQMVDLPTLGADFYAMSAHKAYGPMGFGALFGKRELLERIAPLIYGGGAIVSVSFDKTVLAPLPDRLEPGTPYVTGAIGFAAALDWLQAEREQSLFEREDELVLDALKKLSEFPRVNIVGNPKSRVAIVSFTINGVHPHDVGTILDSVGVAVRSGHHCCQPLMARLGVPATTRISISASNVPEDIDQLVEGLHRVMEVFP